MEKLLHFKIISQYDTTLRLRQLYTLEIIWTRYFLKNLRWQARRQVGRPDRAAISNVDSGADI